MIKETRTGFLEDDNLNFNEFKDCLLLLKERDEAIRKHKHIKMRQRLACAKAIDEMEYYLEDDDKNFIRWLWNEPCVMRNSDRNYPVYIEIGSSVEGIYQFLIYRKLIKHYEPIDERFFMNLFMEILKA